MPTGKKKTRKVLADKPKFRKLYVDNIQGITAPAILRMARQAGVVRVARSVYEEFRVTLDKVMKELMTATIMYLEHSRRKTVSEDDVLHAIEYRFNEKVYGSGATGCSVMKSGGSRKMKPGQKALKEVKYYQKQSGCLMIPKASFGRFIREVTQDLNDDVKFSSVSMNVIQIFVESYMVGILCNAYKIAIDNGRQTLMKKDIASVFAIKRGTSC